jgi:hypothetical protein
MLVSPLDPIPKVITTVDGVITGALGGMLTYYSTVTLVVNI